MYIDFNINIYICSLIRARCIINKYYKMGESRFAKSIVNARINLLFYFITLVLSFFSRKIFLDTLGADFIGLIGTLQNLLGFLNLAELGIGTAIGYVLYKPIFEKDHTQINEIISVFGYLYLRIGQLILLVGFILACFIPLIFSKTGFSLEVIFFAYFVFLTSSLIGYFANYKETLLGADQKNYVITAYFQTSMIIKTLLQMFISYYTKNYYYWIAIELVFGFIFSFILNWKINQVYPWLSSNIKLGKSLLKKYPEVIKYTKQLFVHRIASFVQSQTTPLLIYAFVSLKIVAFYGNYTVIISKLALLINNVLDGTGAGVGNLIAEGNKYNIKKVFWELMAFRYFIGGILVFCLYYLTEPFISLWLGQEYILSQTVLILILCNTYLSQTRGATDLFLFGYGLFSDTWAPCVEAIISLVMSIVGGYFWGLPGVLLGTIVSLFLIVGLWKPYFLYRKGFKTPLRYYWFSIIKFLLILAGSWVLTDFIISNFLIINPAKNYLSWIIYSLCIVTIFSIIQFALMFTLEQGMRDFFYRIKYRILNKS